MGPASQHCIVQAHLQLEIRQWCGRLKPRLALAGVEALGQNSESLLRPPSAKGRTWKLVLNSQAKEPEPLRDWGMSRPAYPA